MSNLQTDFTFSEINFNPFEDTKEIEKIVAINESQREIWLSCMIGGDAGSLAYNESISLNLNGPFQFAHFKRAFELVVNRHEALRSTISANGEHLIIYKNLPFSLELDGTLPDGFISQQMNQPFDLQQGPLFRVFVHQQGTDQHYFTLVIHHLIGDGWSIGIILEDLSNTYNAYCKGVSPALVPPVQISTYASEQYAYLHSDAFKQVERFWLNLYEGTIPVLDLPTDHPRPVPRSYDANRIDHILPLPLINALKETGSKSGSSLVNTLLSAFELFLCQQTGQYDLVIGLPTAGQSATENFELVGHCVNLLPLRSRINPQLSFQDFLKERKKAFFDAYEHQQFSFGQLVKKLNVKRDPSRVPLVPVVFNIDMGMDSAVAFNQLSHQLISNPRAYETFEIFLNATGSKTNFTLEWTYNTRLFEPSTITRMSNAFEALLIKLVETPELSLDKLISGKTQNPSPASEIANITYEGKTLSSLIEATATQYPEKTAITFDKETLSYRDLITQSNQLAAFLQEQGIQKGDMVALCADRTPKLLIALLGILKAGAAYIPLDPEYPEERITFMLEDSAAKFLLTSAIYSGRYQSQAKTFVLEDLWPVLTNYPQQINIPAAEAGDIAYVLYTSGSTGQPKGVQITQYNLVNFLLSMQVQPGISSEDRLLAITTISFDIAGLELYLPLITGATVVLANATSAKDGRLLLSLMEEQQITIMQATPSSWQMILDAGWQKTYPLKVLCGGEALPAELAGQLLSRSAELWNMYGPTETTIWSTIKQVTEIGQPVSIGLPIHHTQVYIMDQAGHPLPPGIEGEIYIGGAGVAKGYLNRPELNAEKFVTDPYSPVQNAKLYKTGDLGRKLPNGQLICSGRIDHQVKIRGHRIELGEIESLIAAHEGIKQAVVLAREDAPGEKRLIAYIVPEDQDGKSNLSWKERWDTLYDIGVETKPNSPFTKRNLDDTLLDQYENSAELTRQAAEWLKASVDRIKALGAKRVLEIGSGGGQLLFELAPGIERYAAADYAQTAITNLNEKLRTEPGKWNHVTAQVAMADHLTAVIKETFNLAVIHSVAQYFPDSDYLISVIREAVKSISGEGCIFIGDMQGKNSLEMCHAMDQLPHSSDHITLAAFREVVMNRVRIEDELVADPGFFYGLQKLIPEITGVNVQLRKGQAINETTKYHYDIWLYVSTPVQLAKPAKTWIWDASITLNAIAEWLNENQGNVLSLELVLNQRTVKDYHLLQLMHLDDLKQQLQILKTKTAQATGGFHPDQLWALGESSGFDTHIRWTTDGTDGTFDVIFIPHSKETVIPEPPVFNSNTENNYDFVRKPYVNNEIPLPKNLVAKWKENLRHTLPAYMVPDDFMALKTFPLTPNAKIDRKAFPKPHPKQVGHAGKTALPRTKNEKLIAAIWAEALGLDDLKVKDDFFELGGHSLLAVKVMVAIEKETGKRLPLSTLFDNSTIEKLALQLAAGEPEEVWDSLVPIHTTGSKPPLFLIHGGGLNILLFKSISKYLDKEQSVYGIQALGLNKAMEIPETLEEIASIHVQEILAAHPDGPYSLAGYSLGGFIAVEIARQLKAMGKEISFLGVMDTYAGIDPPAMRKSERIRRKIIRQFYKVPFFVRSFFQHPKEAIEYQLQIIASKFQSIFISETETVKDMFTPYELEIYKTYDKAYESYVMRPFDVRVSLFRVQKRLYYLDDRVYLGWDKFAEKGVDIHPVPGDHKTFLHPPNDRKFAGILQKVLDRAQQP